MAALVKLQSINQKESTSLVFWKRRRTFIMSPLILYIMKAVAKAKKKRIMNIPRVSRRPTNKKKLKTLNLP
jgi:hypothetical protein